MRVVFVLEYHDGGAKKRRVGCCVVLLSVILTPAISLARSLSLSLSLFPSSSRSLPPSLSLQLLLANVTATSLCDAIAFPEHLVHHALKVSQVDTKVMPLSNTVS